VKLLQTFTEPIIIQCSISSHSRQVCP